MRRCPPALALLSLWLAAAPAARGGEPGAIARRVVSMNPSLTAIVIALGAASSLVGVEEWSQRLHPELASLPTVGGLFNPSLEAVVALEPDLVAMVPSAQQRDFRGRLEALGIEVLELRNITFDEILASIETLGARIGRDEAARGRVAEIRRAREQVSREAAGLARLRAVVVVQRDPLYVVGRGSFIDEMLRVAGAENPADVFAGPYPRADVEWLIAAEPDVLLDATGEEPEPARYWSRWPSLPAVAHGRALAVRPELVTMPGPDLDRGLRELAGLLGAARGREAAPP
jgi:iron complex transport system substrate-binding protein